VGTRHCGEHATSTGEAREEAKGEARGAEAEARGEEAKGEARGEEARGEEASMGRSCMRPSRSSNGGPTQPKASSTVSGGR